MTIHIYHHGCLIALLQRARKIFFFSVSLHIDITYFLPLADHSLKSLTEILPSLFFINIYRINFLRSFIDTFSMSPTKLCITSDLINSNRFHLYRWMYDDEYCLSNGLTDSLMFYKFFLIATHWEKLRRLKSCARSFFCLFNWKCHELPYCWGNNMMFQVDRKTEKDRNWWRYLLGIINDFAFQFVNVENSKTHHSLRQSF